MLMSLVENNQLSIMLSHYARKVLKEAPMKDIQLILSLYGKCDAGFNPKAL